MSIDKSMSTDQKLHHIVGAISHSWCGLVIGGILFIGCLLCLARFNNSNIVSFLVGIMASIIASIIYNITNKYYTSCSTYIWILDQTEILITYIECAQKDCLEPASYRFTLWKRIVDMREKARKLTYKKDFNIISKSFSSIISSMYNTNDLSITEALQRLISAQKQVTAK